MTTVTGTVKNVGGKPDRSKWVFSSQLRQSDDGDSIVSTTLDVVTPNAAGVLTVELDPGPAIVKYGNTTVTVTVPDVDVDLWTMISIGVTTPPVASDQKLIDAAHAYLVALGPVVAFGNTQAEARTAIDAQKADGDLTAIAGLTSAANKGIQFTGAGTAATFDLTAAGKALLDDTDAAAQRTTLDAVQTLTTTAVKTNAYTAAVADLIPADATTAAFTVTLPTAPADKSRVVVKKIDSTTNVVTVAAGGSDVFNKASGSTTLTLSLQNQAMQLQYKASGGIWYVVSTDVPLSGLDGRFPRKQTVDIRDYITTGTTFDLAAVVAAMEAGGGACYVPPGDWTPSAYNIALDETGVSSSGTAKSRFTYKFVGAGKQSRILLPSAMSSSDYLLIANSTNANTFRSHPKVVFEDIAISGTSGGVGSFLRSYQRSFTATRVYLSNMRNGFYHTGYADLCRIEQVYAESMTAGGWVFTGVDNGDGLVIDQLFAYASAGINLNGCLGVVVRNCISGWHKFTNCELTFEGNHFEGDGTTSSTPVVSLSGCTTNVLSGYYEARKYRPTFSLDDVSDTLTSRTIFHEGVHFAQRFDDPGSTYGAARAVDVDIQSLSKQSAVTFKSLRSYCYGASTTGGSITQGPYMAPSVTATGASTSAVAVATILTQAPLRTASDFTITYTNNSGWAIWPTNRLPIITRTLGQPFGSASASTTTSYTTTLGAGTYYYKVWARDIVSRLTQSSAEFSTAITAGQVPLLSLNVYDEPAQIRIVRGTSPGTYTQYAQIAVSGGVQTIYDQGSYISGTAWAAWAGSPAIPGTTGSQTKNGYYYPENNRSEFRQSSIPADFQSLVGDVCWNTAYVAGGTIGWVCTVAGLPGTWIEMPRTPLVQSVTTSVTLAAGVSVTALIGSGGSVTLPTAVGNVGTYTLKNVSGAAVTPATASSQTIDGTTPAAIPNYGSSTLISDGSNWVII